MPTVREDQSAASALFRFDNNRHEYIHIATGDVRPHITGMLQDDGLIDDRWYNEEACERGSCVHRLTSDYDLGALDPADCNSKYKGWLLGHVACMAMVRPKWSYVEQPLMSPVHFFGGRPDRVGLMWDAWSILEVKTGSEVTVQWQGRKLDVHGVQTALQAILVERLIGIPAESIKRYAAYYKDNGKFKLLEQKDTRAEFDKARSIIKRFS